MNIETLYSEVEKYLNGQRAQSELSFEDELDEDDAADVEIEDIETGGVEYDDTPLVEDIDIFN